MRPGHCATLTPDYKRGRHDHIVRRDRERWLAITPGSRWKPLQRCAVARARRVRQNRVMYVPKLPDRRRRSSVPANAVIGLLIALLVGGIALAITDNPLTAHLSALTAEPKPSPPSDHSGERSIRYDDTIDVRVSMALASTVALLVVGVVFVAGRSHAVQVSLALAAAALGLFLFGISAASGLARLSLFLAVALMVGVAVGWTTQPVDD